MTSRISPAIPSADAVTQAALAHLTTDFQDTPCFRPLDGEMLSAQEVALLQRPSHHPVLQLPSIENLEQYLQPEDLKRLKSLFSTYKLSSCIDIVDLIVVHIFQLFYQLGAYLPKGTSLAGLPDVLRNCMCFCTLPNGEKRQECLGAALEDFIELSGLIKRLKAVRDDYFSRVSAQNGKNLAKPKSDSDRLFAELQGSLQLLGRCIRHPEICTDNLTAYEAHGSTSMNVTSVQEVKQCLDGLSAYAEMIACMTPLLECPEIGSVTDELKLLGGVSEKERKNKCQNLLRLITDCATPLFTLRTTSQDPREQPNFDMLRSLAISWIENVRRVLEYHVLVRLDSSYVFRGSYLDRVLINLAYLVEHEFFSVENPAFSNEVVLFVEDFVCSQKFRTMMQCSWGLTQLNPELEKVLQLEKEKLEAKKKRPLKDWAQNSLLLLLQHDIQVFLGLRTPGNPFPSGYVDLLFSEEEELIEEEESPSSLVVALMPASEITPLLPEITEEITPYHEWWKLSSDQPLFDKEEESSIQAEPSETQDVALALSPASDESASVVLQTSADLIQGESKRRKILNILSALGFKPVVLNGAPQGKGSHLQLHIPGRSGVVTVPHAEEIKKGTRHAIIAQVKAVLAEKEEGKAPIQSSAGVNSSASVKHSGSSKKKR